MNNSESNPVGRPPRDGEAADGHIHLRVTMPRKNSYVKAAKPKKLSEWIIEQLDNATMRHIITTKIDPKELRTKHSRITVTITDTPIGDAPTDVDTVIFNEKKNGDEWQFEVGISYPGCSPNVMSVKHAFPVLIDGKPEAIAPDYLLTRQDFNDMVNKKPFKVPARL